jgi:hypothetical protein
MTGMIWVEKQKRHLKAPPAYPVKEVSKPIQADKEIPEKFARNVRAIILPLYAAGASPAVHAGAMTMMNETPTPAMIRAQSICARFCADAWRTTPQKQKKHAT